MDIEGYRRLAEVRDGGSYEEFVDDVRGMVARIAWELDMVEEGLLWTDEDGEEHVVDSDWEQDEHPECGGWEQMSLGEWASDSAYDVRYTVDSSMAYVGASLMVAGGGPTIWVDTMDDEVQLHWAGTRATCPICWDAARELDVVCEEMWDSRQGR